MASTGRFLRRFDLGNKAIEGIFDSSLLGAIGEFTIVIVRRFLRQHFVVEIKAFLMSRCLVTITSQLHNFFTAPPNICKWRCCIAVSQWFGLGLRWQLVTHIFPSEVRFDCYSSDCIAEGIV